MYNQSHHIEEVKVLDNVQDYIALLQELGKLIGGCKKLKFSTGKWSKSWIKIEYERLEE